MRSVSTCVCTGRRFTREHTGRHGGRPLRKSLTVGPVSARVFSSSYTGRCFSRRTHGRTRARTTRAKRRSPPKFPKDSLCFARAAPLRILIFRKVVGGCETYLSEKPPTHIEGAICGGYSNGLVVRHAKHRQNIGKT